MARGDGVALGCVALACAVLPVTGVWKVVAAFENPKTPTQSRPVRGHHVSMKPDMMGNTSYLLLDKKEQVGLGRNVIRGRRPSLASILDRGLGGEQVMKTQPCSAARLIGCT